MGAVDTYKIGHRTAHSQLEKEDHFITHPVYIKLTLKVEWVPYLKREWTREGTERRRQLMLPKVSEGEEEKSSEGRLKRRWCLSWCLEQWGVVLVKKERRNLYIYIFLYIAMCEVLRCLKSSSYSQAAYYPLVECRGLTHIHLRQRDIEKYDVISDFCFFLKGSWITHFLVSRTYWIHRRYGVVKKNDVIHEFQKPH